MSANHAVSDLVAIIRNGYLARKKLVKSPVSRLRENILKILKEEGYILNYSIVTEENGIKEFGIHLKYHLANPVVSNIEVISKPGKRVYCNSSELPVVKNGLGMVIISTSSGVISDHVARELKVGGEILLKIF